MVRVYPRIGFKDRVIAESENLVPDIANSEMPPVGPLESILDNQGYALGNLLVLVDKFFG